jgi:hypothetical protein
MPELFGTFRLWARVSQKCSSNLLASSGQPDIAILWQSPSYAYNPARHSPDAVVPPSESLFAELSPELVSFIDRISRVTGCPRLPPREYRALFVALKEELRTRHAINSPQRLPRMSRRYAKMRGLIYRTPTAISSANGCGRDPLPGPVPIERAAKEPSATFTGRG